MRAGISAYLQDRFKYTTELRNDTKVKIAKALRTDRGFVNDLIAKAQSDAQPKKKESVTVKPAVVIEENPMVKETVEEVEEMEEIKPVVENNLDAIQKQEKNAANLEFVYKNIDAYRDLKDTFYLRQAQVYLEKMIDEGEK